MQITHSHVLLDACCIFNFCASGQFLAILKSLPAEIVVTTVVSNWTKIFTVIASEAKQSQPLRLRHSTAFHSQ